MADHTDDILTTVATHLNSLSASVVQSRLQYEGIEAYVVDANIAGTAWYLSNACGPGPRYNPVRLMRLPRACA